MAEEKKRTKRSLWKCYNTYAFRNLEYWFVICGLFRKFVEISNYVYENTT